MGPSPDPKSASRMRAGTLFGLEVQEHFLGDLVGATGVAELVWPLMRPKGRLDLHVLPLNDERMLVIIEIKNSDWDAIRTRPNVQRHLRQLQRYLDDAIDELLGGDWDSVVGVLLYNRRPADPAKLAVIDELAAAQAIDVVWYEDVGWNPNQEPSRF